MGASVRINGNEYSWASLECETLGAGILTGPTAINYNDELTPALTRGTSAVPRGSTRGQWSGAADIELLRADYDRWILALGPGFSEIELPFVVSYAETLRGVTVDTLLVKLSKSAVSLSDSADGARVKCDLFLLAPILWNGIPRVLSI